MGVPLGAYRANIRHWSSFCTAKKKFSLKQLFRSANNTIQLTQMRLCRRLHTGAQCSRLNKTWIETGTRGQSNIRHGTQQTPGCIRQNITQMNLKRQFRVLGYPKNMQTLYLLKLITSKSKITVTGSIGLRSVNRKTVSELPSLTDCTDNGGSILLSIADCSHNGISIVFYCKDLTYNDINIAFYSKIALITASVLLSITY